MSKYTYYPRSAALSKYQDVNKELWKGYPEDFFDDEVDGSSWYQAIGDIISSMALDFAEQTNLPNDHLYDAKKSASSKPSKEDKSAI